MWMVVSIREAQLQRVEAEQEHVCLHAEELKSTLDSIRDLDRGFYLSHVEGVVKDLGKHGNL